MANPDRRLLELLEPIFRNHYELVEAALPRDLRGNWRKAAAFIQRRDGPKQHDHGEMLLAMAGLDTDGKQPPRKLARDVLVRFPVERGIGSDERIYAVLPDGSRPARKDLLDRLSRRYAAQRQDLLEEIRVGRAAAERIGAVAARIEQEGISLPAAGQHRPSNPKFAARLRALRPKLSPLRVTASQVDQTLDAIRKATKRS